MNADTGLLNPVWPGTGMDTLLADEAWVEAMLSVEVALARTQARLGVIPSDAVAPIAEAAESAHIDVPSLAVRARGSANPVVELVREFTAAVAALSPDAASFVHRGGTSQDILDSATMLLAARESLRLAGGAAHTAAALAEGLRVFPSRLAANLNLGDGTIVTERLNVALTPILGKAPAKDLLGRVAARSAAGEGSFADLLRAQPELTTAFGDTLDELLDPANYLGAADELVDRVLARRAALT